MLTCWIYCEFSAYLLSILWVQCLSTEYTLSLVLIYWVYIESSACLLSIHWVQCLPTEYTQWVQYVPAEYTLRSAPTYWVYFEFRAYLTSVQTHNMAGEEWLQREGWIGSWSGTSLSHYLNIIYKNNTSSNHNSSFTFKSHCTKLLYVSESLSQFLFNIKFH